MEWYRTNLCGIEKPEYPSTGYVRNLIRYNIRCFFFFFSNRAYSRQVIYIRHLSVRIRTKSHYVLSWKRMGYRWVGSSLGWELIPWTVHPKTALFEEMSAFLGFLVQPK